MTEDEARALTGILFSNRVLTGILFCNRGLILQLESYPATGILSGHVTEHAARALFLQILSGVESCHS